jgi:hypothetical protein
MSKRAVKKVRRGGGGNAAADPGANHGACGSGRYFRERVKRGYNEDYGLLAAFFAEAVGRRL